MTTNYGTGSAATTHYLLDGQNVVQEMLEGLDENNNVVLNPAATYLAGPRGVEYRQDESTGKRSWYLYDGLGSVIAEVDEADSPGNQTGFPQITATRTYDVYGNPLISSGATESSHKFCGGLGHTSDADTGLTYMRARYYDPAIGRFISEDPAGDGANWYAYCGGNPANLVDSSGKEPVELAEAVLLATAGSLLVFCGVMIMMCASGSFFTAAIGGSKVLAGVYEIMWAYSMGPRLNYNMDFAALVGGGIAGMKLGEAMAVEAVGTAESSSRLGFLYGGIGSIAGAAMAVHAANIMGAAHAALVE